MDRWQNRVAVVTGASAGIGAAIFKDLAKAGLIVIGLARRVDRVEELKKSLTADQRSRVHAYKCDVSSEESVNSAFEWIIQKFGGVDILVNNAGLLLDGNLSTMPIADIRRVLDTNVMGVVHCTQHAFKSMKDRSFDGHILIVNSILGHSIPIFPTHVGFNIYPSSKYALTAITEMYRQEFKGLGTKIKITSISPGLVETDMVEDIKKDIGPVVLNAQDISDGVMYAISTPPHVQVHELTIKPIGENM
ncbi:farnesol dehydrogenase-like [Episyrphus balteatus]|uniref:farnesol dehydrogenase-like n=1 Tax=Episyrphus balteatus TaxID=286459 RepID=UPI0024867028|nr:farnesol dehydrogenase-like [Episyrphus balteatus]